MKCLLLQSTVLSLLLLASCTTTPESRPVQPSRLAGKWINGEGDLLRLDIDNTFTLDLREQNRPEISGEFRIKDEQIRFTNRKSFAVAQCSHTVGIYRFKQQGATLWLRPLQEPCEKLSRKLSATVWHRP